MMEILCKCNGDIPGVAEGDLPSHSHRIRQTMTCLDSDHPTVKCGEVIEFVQNHPLIQDVWSRQNWAYSEPEEVMVFYVDWKQVARELMMDRSG